MRGLRDFLENADQRHVALGHFNASDLVGLKAVITAARQLNVPVLVGVSEGERDFIGVGLIAARYKGFEPNPSSRFFSMPTTRTPSRKAETAAKAGFDEIIFDLSDRPFEENVKRTKQAVQALKSIRPDVLIEGEIGYIGRFSEIVAEGSRVAGAYRSRRGCTVRLGDQSRYSGAGRRKHARPPAINGAWRGS
jgi:fructose-bisphosphate aldolase class II